MSNASPFDDEYEIAKSPMPRNWLFGIRTTIRYSEVCLDGLSPDQVLQARHDCERYLQGATDVIPTCLFVATEEELDLDGDEDA